jgi:hypothetical protein
MVDSKPGDIFQPGDFLNNTYRIECILGRGGTSEVYRARNDISGRLTAIKVLKQEFSGDEAFITLMRREEEIRELRHDAIVRYSENHRTPSGLVYLLMDYVEGPALDTLMKQGGMAAGDLVDICRRVCDGLSLAHSKKIVHRDLSPDNIILRNGIPSEAVIIDFGIAKDANPGAHTIVGNEFAGKYAYAAPEQLSGHSDSRTDLYALGALLLATFRGKRPEPGSNPMEVVKKKQLPLDTEGVPEPLKTLIDKLSQPDAADRFQTAEEVVRAIDAAYHAEGDRTVIAPRSSVAPGGTLTPTTVLPRSTETPRPPMPSGATAAVAAAPAKSGKGGLWVGLLVVLLAAGGGGAWFTGLLGGSAEASLPAADPYLLTVEKAADGKVSAKGNAPSEIVSKELAAAITALGGTSDLTLASGAIGESWGTDVLVVLAAVAKLDSWKIEISGNEAAVSGLTSDQAAYEAVSAALGVSLPGALKGKAEITYKPALLSVDAVNAVLAEQSDCGPLTLASPPAAGYGPNDTITVTGKLSGALRQVQLVDALNAIAESRKVSLVVELLSRAGCQP